MSRLLTHHSRQGAKMIHFKMPCQRTCAPTFILSLFIVSVFLLLLLAEYNAELVRYLQNFSRGLSAGKGDLATEGELRKAAAVAAVQSCRVEPLKNIEQFFSYPEREMFPCHSKIRLGGKSRGKVLDGDKWVCLDPSVAPRPPGCLVYSFGINNEWSFDDAMELYGCQVWSFDPTMPRVKDHKRKPNLTFFSLGIAAKNSEKYQRLGDIMVKLGHEGRQLDYLKLDIEGTEVPVLEQLVSEQPHLLTSVTQLACEVHPGRYKDVRWYPLNLCCCQHVVRSFPADQPAVDLKCLSQQANL